MQPIRLNQTTTAELAISYGLPRAVSHAPHAIALFMGTFKADGQRVWGTDVVGTESWRNSTTKSRSLQESQLHGIRSVLAKYTVQPKRERSQAYPRIRVGLCRIFVIALSGGMRSRPAWGLGGGFSTGVERLSERERAHFGDANSEGRIPVSVGRSCDPANGDRHVNLFQGSRILHPAATQQCHESPNGGTAMALIALLTVTTGAEDIELSPEF